MGSVTRLPVKFVGHGQIVPFEKIEFKGFAQGKEPTVRYSIAVDEFKSVAKIVLDSGVQFECYYDTITLAFKIGGVMLLRGSVEEFSNFVNNVFMNYVKRFTISYSRKDGDGYYGLELLL